jgi:hypothetical protein
VSHTGHEIGVVFIDVKEVYSSGDKRCTNLSVMVIKDAASSWELLTSYCHECALYVYAAMSRDQV